MNVRTSNDSEKPGRFVANQCRVLLLVLLIVVVNDRILAETGWCCYYKWYKSRPVPRGMYCRNKILSSIGNKCWYGTIHDVDGTILYHGTN